MDWWAGFFQIVQNIVLVVAAVFGSYIGWKGILPALSQAEAARNQADLARRTHVLGLFESAASKLEDPKLAIRLGAIYTLRYIKEGYPEFSGPVLELLTAHLRERSGHYESETPPVDVRAIMTILKLRS